jgi:hypothetical protein
LKLKKEENTSTMQNALTNYSILVDLSSIDRVQKQREVAEAVGLRWCTNGSHRMAAAAFMELRASCLACLERICEGYPAQTAAVAIDQNAEQGASIVDREGAMTEPIVDDEFGEASLKVL